MPYSYDPIFAVDPANSANIAKNASITIFDPADPTQAPVAITDPTGSPLPNPITVDAAGMAGAFQHPTLARVGWKGAGFTGYFTSYEGMFNETLAAKDAAQEAAMTAGAEAVAEVEARIAAGEFKGEKGADGKNGVNGANVLPTQQAIEQALINEGPAKTALDTSYAPQGFATVRKAGDGKIAALDWRHDGDTAYVFHVVAGANTQSLAAIFAIGTDRGLGDGYFISHKNSGAGIRGVGHGGSSILQYMVGYGKSTLYNGEVFKNNQGMKLFAKVGEGFGDGVTTAGSTTFTSATANFTGADVGATISQTTSKGGLNVAGSIPSGTTIAAVTNATTVVLSNPATADGTAITFLIGGRAPAATQQLFTIYDTNGTSKRYEFALGKYTGIVPHDIQSNDVAQQSLKVTAAVGQTAEIFTVLKDGSASGALSVTASGIVAARFGSSLTNAGNTASNAVSITNSGTAAHSLYITRGASQTGDQISVRSSAGALQTRIDKDGTIMTKVTAAPVDAQLTNGEVAIYFDSTNGAAKLMLKAKQADGTIRTGSVNLV